MVENNSKLGLIENEEFWLKEIYQLFLKNQFKPDIKKLERKSLSELNPHFNPKDINPYLLKYGNEITPFAIEYFDPITRCFEEIVISGGQVCSGTAAVTLIYSYDSDELGMVILFPSPGRD